MDFRLSAFPNALAEDEVVLLRGELSIVTFGPLKRVQDFVSAGPFTAPTLHTGGDRR